MGPGDRVAFAFWLVYNTHNTSILDHTPTITIMTSPLPPLASTSLAVASTPPTPAPATTARRLIPLSEPINVFSQVFDQDAVLARFMRPSTGRTREVPIAETRASKETLLAWREVWAPVFAVSADEAGPAIKRRRGRPAGSGKRVAKALPSVFFAAKQSASTPAAAGIGCKRKAKAAPGASGVKESGASDADEVGAADATVFKASKANPARPTEPPASKVRMPAKAPTNAPRKAPTKALAAAALKAAAKLAPRLVAEAKVKESGDTLSTSGTALATQPHSAVSDPRTVRPKKLAKAKANEPAITDAGEPDQAISAAEGHINPLAAETKARSGVATVIHLLAPAIKHSELKAHAAALFGDSITAHGLGNPARDGSPLLCNSEPRAEEITTDPEAGGGGASSARRASTPLSDAPDP